jgi:putative transposase
VGTEQQIIATDLNYIRVNQCWNNLCVLPDLSERQIASYCVGQYKTVGLVMFALRLIKQLLSS